MRTAALPTFRKLYGRIETDLEADNKITVMIQNNYNTYDFGGKKHLVLSTTSWMGGKNDFLGVAYLAVGGICLFMAIAFIIVYVLKPRWVSIVQNMIVPIRCLRRLALGILTIWFWYVSSFLLSCVFFLFDDLAGLLEIHLTYHGIGIQQNTWTSA